SSGVNFLARGVWFWALLYLGWGAPTLGDVSVIFFQGVYAPRVGAGGALGYAQYPMAHNGIVELLCIYGFIFGGLAVLLLLLLFVYSVFLLVFRRRKTACTELGFLCSAFIIWFVNYVFSGGGLFHPVGAALFWLVVFRFLYILRRKRDVEHISKEVVYG
ncbi:hypothetical protein OFL48_12480, partial [Pseudomonas aeruginosa]|uniref:hypothetical protein n=1 Tax=Pseudomonas aeruginosa TaxID=287 RepID=UPI0021F1A086